jgi:hypothetical protein
MNYDNYSQYPNEYDGEEFNVQDNKEVDKEIERVKQKMAKVDYPEFSYAIFDRWGIRTMLDREFYCEYLRSEKELDEFVTDLRFDCFQGGN